MSQSDRLGGLSQSDSSPETGSEPKSVIRKIPDKSHSSWKEWFLPITDQDLNCWILVSARVHTLSVSFIAGGLLRIILSHNLLPAVGGPIQDDSGLRAFASLNRYAQSAELFHELFNSCNIAILRHFLLHPLPLLWQWCLPIKAGLQYSAAAVNDISLRPAGLTSTRITPATTPLSQASI